jgi:UPF0755 protein
MANPPPDAPSHPLPGATPPHPHPHPPAKRKRRTPWLIIGCVLFAVLIAAVAVPLGLSAMLAAGPLKQDEVIIVTHGMPTREIAALLDKEGAVYSPLLFRFAAKVFAAGTLKAGEYQLTTGQSAADIAVMMHDGRAILHKLTIAEGLTAVDIAHALENTTSLQGQAPIAPEGMLLPETYEYSYGDRRADIVKRMEKGMQDLLNAEWPKRDADLPLKSPQDAVIMASVIEKETGKVVERPRIAGVFYNRLHYNMRLQSDPTVIYAIVQAKGPLGRELTRADLLFPSPINTYTSDGLPSQPICNPGRAAIMAALHPEKNDFLYFVADGTGGHVFSRNLNEHINNVARYRDRNEKP